jgi:hypothetical protein
VGWPEGLHGREGDPIPWVVQVEGKESWWIGILLELEIWVLGYVRIV